MKTYQVTANGMIFGNYEADSEQEAKDLCAKDAGYESEAEMETRLEQPSELQAKEIMKVDGQEIYGIEVENGILLAYANDGSAVTRLNEDENPLLWPVDSEVSAYYEHVNGIVLERADAEKLGIEIE